MALGRDPFVLLLSSLPKIGTSPILPGRTCWGVLFLLIRAGVTGGLAISIAFCNLRPFKALARAASSVSGTVEAALCFPDAMHPKSCWDNLGYPAIYTTGRDYNCLLAILRRARKWDGRQGGCGTEVRCHWDGRWGEVVWWLYYIIHHIPHSRNRAQIKHKVVVVDRWYKMHLPYTHAHTDTHTHPKLIHNKDDKCAILPGNIKLLSWFQSKYEDFPG